MPASSTAYAEASVLEPRASRALTLWWLAVHALLAATVGALGLPFGLTSALLATLAGHATVRRPRCPASLVHYSDGRWAVPAKQRYGLQPAPGTSFTTWWVDLVLVGADGRRLRALLLRDQLDAEGWRRLQLALREHVSSGPDA